MELKNMEHVALFQGMIIEDIKKALECISTTVKTYQKNQSVILMGSSIHEFGIILSGCLQIIREDIMGNRLIVDQVLEGDIFGETLACAGVEDSPVSVYATNTSEVLWISIERIVTPCSSTCHFHSQLLTNLLKLLAQKNLYLNEKIQLLSKRSIRDKIMSYLLIQGEHCHNRSFELSLNRNELADYLCIDRSALSRELSKLKEEGIIEYQKNRFKIIK